MLQSYNFLHNARPPLGAIAAPPPRFPLRRGGFFRNPSPPYAHPNSQTPNNRKRPAPFLRQFPVFDQNSACFSSSAAYRLTPLHNLRPTRARTHARQQLFDFCLHLFTRRAQFTHSQRIKCEGFCAFAFTAFRSFAPPPWSSD